MKNHLLKQSLIYLTLSIIVVVFARYAQLLIVYVDLLYTYINIKLAPIFNHSELATFIRKVISLVVLPLLIAAIPALIFRVIKGKHMPYFIEMTWLIWLVIVLSKILIR